MRSIKSRAAIGIAIIAVLLFAVPLIRCLPRVAPISHLRSCADLHYDSPPTWYEETATTLGIVDVFNTVMNIESRSPKFDDAACEDALQFSRVDSVELVGVTVHDEGLRSLLQLPKLHILSIKSDGITGSKLENVGVQSRILNVIQLDGSRISNNVAQLIPQCSTVTDLLIASPLVTDEMLDQVSDWGKIECLHISETSISGESLPRLITAPALETLIVSRKQRNSDGMKKLLAMRPDIAIVVK